MKLSATLEQILVALNVAAPTDIRGREDQDAETYMTLFVVSSNSDYDFYGETNRVSRFQVDAYAPTIERALGLMDQAEGALDALAYVRLSGSGPILDNGLWRVRTDFQKFH